MRVEIGCSSRAKGPVNEDAYLVDEGHLLFGVFDGLGGSVQGAEAAGLAAEAIRAAYDEHGEGGDCAAERAFLLLTVRGAGELISATLEDGFTTASVVKVCNVIDGRVTALVCNVGDSRVYRYTAAGELDQCTLDDSPFGSDWDLQLHLSEVEVPTGLLEYSYFARRHVMDRALGERHVSPRLWEVPADDGDVLLAVSDGVTDNLTFSELRQLLRGDPHDPDSMAHRLVDAAYARSHQTGHPRAKVDDITAVAAQVRVARATAGTVASDCQRVVATQQRPEELRSNEFGHDEQGARQEPEEHTFHVSNVEVAGGVQADGASLPGVAEVNAEVRRS